jgi:hypothetical protein
MTTTKNYYVFILALFLSSCSLFYDPIIPTEVEPYVDRFIYEAGRHGTSINKDRIKVEFKDLGITAGEAKRGIIRLRYTIFINEGPWRNEWNEDHKTYIVFHELGHAALGRPHCNDVEWVWWADTTRFVSIMASGKMYYTVHPTHDFFNNFYGEYMNELFK